MFDYQYLVFIGRFQPFHLAHYETVKIALQHAEQVILCLGSAQNERSLKNPFLAEERKQMILANFSSEQQQRILFTDIIDVYNDEKWKALVREKVAELVPSSAKIGLIGHEKDESSYYLDLFPEWQRVPLDSLQGAISATPLRERYYQGEIVPDVFPQGTLEFLKHFQTTATYQQLQQQYLAK